MDILFHWWHILIPAILTILLCRAIVKNEAPQKTEKEVMGMIYVVLIIIVWLIYGGIFIW